ncbi:hypothetical protein M407DRAFT_233511 [Tulasnella calospora MUT 4182]|uniref:Coilin n=1 Tax=Tulasnella calospora MUT 4182 TaxID=1051891 RepID=A0A0C3M0A9_9AGAM|nr:hypothetical protein M407DRAFT_233511 [Tulasnella calospora MUT 4182]
MRIRIASHPPLPVLKAWFGIDDHAAATQTVLDLKRGLSEQLCAPGHQHLLLELEGFELLDESLCYQVLREGDLINIKQSSLAHGSNKRKSAAIALESAEEGRSNKRAKHTPSKDKDEPSSSSSSDESESSSETETESSSSDCESTTSSGSDSSTSSSSSDSPSVETTLPRTPISNNRLSSLAAARLGHFVPPGQGKASTRDRNRRRRVARKYKQASAHGSPAVSIPTQKTGTPKSPVPVPSVLVQAPQEPLMMMSLKNSNKRKGYKERLAGSSGPMKLVFCDPDGSRPRDASPERDSHSLPPLASLNSHKVKLPRLVPPSERMDLPANIFVTSIDVEADLWKRRPEAKKAVRSGVHDVNGRSEYVGKKQVAGFGNAVQFEEDVSLNYGDPEDTDIRKQTSNPQPLKVDWDAVELGFRSFPQTDPETLSVGVIVAWQALGIDPSTLTPAMLLHLGEIISVSEEAIEVRLLRRPNSAKTIGFGLRLTQDESVGDQDEPEVLRCRVDETKEWKLAQQPLTNV